HSRRSWAFTSSTRGRSCPRRVHALRCPESNVRFTPESGHSELHCVYRPVVASGSGERAALAEYRRPLTRSSHLSSAARPFAILNERKAVRDLVPQTPSAGPARNPSLISRFCAALISLGGGFNLLAPCSGATAAVREAWTDGPATACGFAASVLFPWE